MRIGLTESRSVRGTEQADGMLGGQLFGPGGKTPLEYWIDGRRIRASWRAPRRKRPGLSRATARRTLLRHACVMRCKGQRDSVRCGRKENYRAKAKKFARLEAVAKSLRHSRQCRKLAEMYWALALGEEPDRAQPSKMNVKRMATYPIDVTNLCLATRRAPGTASVHRRPHRPRSSTSSTRRLTL